MGKNSPIRMSQRQVGISHSHHNGRQQCDGDIPIPIAMGGENNRLWRAKSDRPVPHRPRLPVVTLENLPRSRKNNKHREIIVIVL